MMQATHILSTIPRPEANSASSSTHTTSQVGSGTADIKIRPQNISSITSSWFAAEAKLPMLETQVSVTLTRLVADHEGEAGRYKSNC
jgi:hypothetical protein